MCDALDAMTAMRKQGRRLVGCFPLYPPLELIHSFGLTPVVLWAMRDAVAGYSTSDRHVQSYACQVARTLTEFVLDKGPGLFDALFMYNACDTLRNLPEILDAGLREKEAAVPVFRLHVPALPQDRSGAREYLRDRVSSVVSDLERFTGRAFSADAFASSTALYGKQRALCRAVDALCAGGRMPFAAGAPLLEQAHFRRVEDHVALLEEALTRYGDRPADTSGVRVMVSGIQAPPAGLTEVMDASGLTVAVNDIATMARSYGDGPAPAADPAQYYCDFYFSHPPCTTMLPAGDRRVAFIRRRAREHAVRGLIIFGEKFCEYEYFETPHIQEVLGAEGVATLSVELGADDLTNLMPARTRIEAFAEMLRGRAA